MSGEYLPQDYRSKPTGDPFIDTGGLVLQVLHQNFPDKTLLQIIEFATDVYIEKWKEKLHAIFHTNSKILNPSTKGKHKQDTLEFFQTLILGQPIKDSIEGYCKTCGNKGRLYVNSREFFPLSGSGAFVNFHHFHEKGTYLCNQCSIKLFFVPLGVLQLGGNIGLLQVQSEKSKRFLIKNIIQENLDKISRQTSEGILKSKFSNPKNALFEFASQIITDVQDEEFADFLQLFHFTNFGATPNCDMYVLPNPVFKFLNKVIFHHRKSWYYFVHRYFYLKGAEWNGEKNSWVKVTKKEQVVLAEDEYLNNKNNVFERLLANKSILPQLLKIHREHYYQQLEPFSLMIAIHYVKEVSGMSNEQLELIRRIASVVLELSRKENNYKKYLTMLEGAGKAHMLRGALIKIIKENYKYGAHEPLIRLEEYVHYLFPDGQYWGEVRDLLLIHLYEKLHEEGVNAEEIPETPIQIIEDEATNTY